MKKDAYYFSHDANAFSDPKIQRLVMSHGIEGYAFFFICIEMMRSEKDYMIFNDAEAIAYHLRIDASKAKAMLDKCLSVALFYIDGDKLFSTSFLKRMGSADKLRNKRIEAGRKGGKSSKAQAPLKQNESKAEALKERKGKETKVKEKKELLSPQLHEIEKYFDEKEMPQVEAQKFFDYWEAAEWKNQQGKKVQRWKMNAATWKSNFTKSNPQYKHASRNSQFAATTVMPKSFKDMF